MALTVITGTDVHVFGQLWKSTRADRHEVSEVYIAETMIPSMIRTRLRSFDQTYKDVTPRAQSSSAGYRWQSCPVPSRYKLRESRPWPWSCTHAGRDPTPRLRKALKLASGHNQRASCCVRCPQCCQSMKASCLGDEGGCPLRHVLMVAVCVLWYAAPRHLFCGP